MQVPGAQHFRRQHLRKSGPVLLLQDAVAQDPRRVDDARERGHLLETIQERGDIRLPRHVGLDHVHVRTLLREGGERRGRLRGRAPPPRQHQVSGSALHHPVRHAQAEATQTTGDQVGRIRPQTEDVRRP